MTTDAILAVAARPEEERVREYRRTVRTILVEGVDPDRLDRIRDRVAIGGAEFAAKARRVRAVLRRETAGKKDVRRRRTFAEVVAVVERVRGEAWSEFGQRHGDTGKWLVLRLARRHTGMTLAELGAACGGMDYAAVGVGLKRFDRRLSQVGSLRQLEQQASQMLDVET